MSLKKAVRTLQVMLPALQEARYSGHLRAIELLGFPYRKEAGAIRHFQKDRPTIVDIGANRGFSVSSFLTLKPDAKVIAFEPLPRQSEAVRKRFASRNVTVHSCGLSSEDGKLTIFTPIYRGFVFDALSALRYEDAANWVNDSRFYFFDKSKLRVERADVEVTSLDKFQTAPDIIKIYTQGHEPSVVAGARKTIARHEPAIIVPARQPAIHRSLRDIGYQLYAYRDGKLFEGLAGNALSWYLTPKHLPMFQCEKVTHHAPRWSDDIARIHEQGLAGRSPSLNRPGTAARNPSLDLP